MFMPPPYIPPEYQNCKYSEMPEEYKSAIDAWVSTIDAQFRERATAAKYVFFIAMGVAAIIGVATLLAYA